MRAEARKLYNPVREVTQPNIPFRTPELKSKSRLRVHRLILTIMYGTLLLICCIYFFRMNGFEASKNEELNKLKAVQVKQVNIEKELNRQIRLLNDPDYIANYARNEYLVSKDGETLYIVPKAEENHNKN
ncbi:septum formation initiator family protein [Bacillus sp. RG28]|uniref:Septum formation initiator family protein n=1 Tax=Gottfriedia endophytica TaxID=2820819 RepID=A0A940NP62_9BACI|nr:septum formation initiator family protein [Gottfriedia endophytica]MBP0724331.1 septum formation initiator family protein [Gottfriedia endophytica]